MSFLSKSWSSRKQTTGLRPKDIRRRRSFLETLESRYCLDGSPPPLADEATTTGPNIPGFDDLPVGIHLAANDYLLDPDGDVDPFNVHIEIIDFPDHGTLTSDGVVVDPLNPNFTSFLGLIEYTPDVGFEHDVADTFTYKITDEAGNQSLVAATCTVFVDPGPIVPDPADVFESAKATQPHIVDVFGNFYVIDPFWYVDHTSIVITTPPTLGNAVLFSDSDPFGEGYITYTYTGDPIPEGDFVEDTFQFTVADENGDVSAPVTVHMFIVPNTAPIANSDFVTTQVDVPAEISVTFNDFDNDPDDFVGEFTIEVLTQPANGMATTDADGDLAHDGFVTYIPDPGFQGIDTFTYRAADTDGVFTEETLVSVKVKPPAAIIDNGLIQLGINPEGHLNVDFDFDNDPETENVPSAGGVGPTGLRYLPTNNEATAPGCLCEGWGAADADSGITGYANVSSDSGDHGMKLISFTSTPYSAVSVVEIDGSEFGSGGGGGGGSGSGSGGGEETAFGAAGFGAGSGGDMSVPTLRVTHDYHPTALTPNLYEVTVTIENISDHDITDLRYRRVMDWDIEPTAFSEFVTIQGAEDSPNILFNSNDGFATANPLGFRSSLGFEGDFIDAGIDDHGALFDFGNFGTIAPGQVTSFNIYYGAAGNEADALAAIDAVNASLYSLGQPNYDFEDESQGPETGEPNTFIFAFGNLRTDPENNHPPVAEDDQLHTAFEAPGSGVGLHFHASALLVNDSDPDPTDALSLRIESVDEDSEFGGTIEVNPQTFNITYSPPTGFRGRDSFTYRISDGLAFDEATVFVDVGAPQVVSIHALYGGADGAPPTMSYDITANPGDRDVLPWKIKGVRVVFDTEVHADLGDLTGAAFSSVTGDGTPADGSTTQTWLFSSPQFLASLNLSLLSGPSGIFSDEGSLFLDGDKDLMGGDAYDFALEILEGDFNDDRVVSNSDMTAVNAKKSPPNAYDMFADIDGDGDVDANDVNRVRARLRNQLPPPPAV